MTWEWFHNFPVSKDTFTKPVDYPTEGWDTIIACWWEDVFNAVEAVEEYLLDGILKDRGDPAAYDFVLTDFITDGAAHDLDLGPWKRIGTTHFLIYVFVTTGTQPGGIAFWKKGNVNEFNITGIGAGPGADGRAFNMVVACDADGKIEYMADNVDWVVINLTVRGDLV